ncbi:hypothetical protein [Rhodanobacter lindaniclasticus]|nr:hypothetical protein [Rhodanobacter lindaniclasticus]
MTADINLAVHGLEGFIRAGNDAVTYYKMLPAASKSMKGTPCHD